MSLELKIPPPVIALICALSMWMFGRYFSELSFDFSSRKSIAVLLLIIGFTIDILALIKFKQKQTTINPMKPEQSTDLVITGIYKFTRNPMYLGLLIILSAWAAFVGNFVALIFLPVFICYITKFQIIPEEAFMQAKFGESFATYRQKVRRWI